MKHCGCLLSIGLRKVGEESDCFMCPQRIFLCAAKDLGGSKRKSPPPRNPKKILIIQTGLKAQKAPSEIVAEGAKQGVRIHEADISRMRSLLGLGTAKRGPNPDFVKKELVAGLLEKPLSYNVIREIMRRFKINAPSNYCARLNAERNIRAPDWQSRNPKLVTVRSKEAEIVIRGEVRAIRENEDMRKKEVRRIFPSGTFVFRNVRYVLPAQHQRFLLGLEVAEICKVIGVGESTVQKMKDEARGFVSLKTLKSAFAEQERRRGKHDRIW